MLSMRRRPLVFSGPEPLLQTLTAAALTVALLVASACSENAHDNHPTIPPSDTCVLSADSVDLDEEELAIYAQSINGIFARTGSIVLLDSTIWTSDVVLVADRLVSNTTDHPMTQETRNALLAANNARKAVPDSIPFGRPYKLIERRQVPLSWDDFHDQYPGSWGLTAVSQVGFGIHSCQAAVYCAQWRSELSGSGYLVFLSRGENEWVIEDLATIWFSKKP